MRTRKRGKSVNTGATDGTDGTDGTDKIYWPQIQTITEILEDRRRLHRFVGPAYLCHLWFWNLRNLRLSVDESAPFDFTQGGLSGVQGRNLRKSAAYEICGICG